MLTILDPTSLLGGEILGRLARVWPGARPRLFHTGEEPEHLIVEVAGEPALVAPLTDLDELERSGTIVATALPAAATAERLLAWLRAHPRVVLVDGTQPGMAGAEARCVAAGALPPARPSPPWYHLADPALAAPCRLLAALGPLAPVSASLTLLGPAAAFGMEALDELAAQGAARLSGNPEAKPTRLPAVLAFDLAPAAAVRSAALEGQVRELFPGLDPSVTAIDAGVFHGHLAAVTVTCAADATVERTRALIRSVPGLRLLRRNETTTVSAAVQQGGIACGGVAVRGRTVSAWLCADGLRVGGADAVLDLLGALNAS